MKYLAFIGTEGGMPAEAVEEMNRDFPPYFEEMERRAVRIVGRELEVPQTSVTVRVRDGETLVTDGPYSETKEFIGGIDLLECVDLDEAIEVESKSPVARFLPFEIRPAQGKFRVSERASALEAHDDTTGTPYLLMIWEAGRLDEGPVDDAAIPACEDWRDELEAHEILILGGAIGTPDTATTLAA